MKRIFFKKSDSIVTAPNGYEALGFNNSSVAVRSSGTPIYDKVVESTDINASVSEFLSTVVTIDDSLTYLISNGTIDGISIKSDTTSSYDVTVTGIKRNDNSSPSYYIENHKGLISNYDGNTFLIGKTSSIVYDSMSLNQASVEKTPTVYSTLSTKFSKKSLFVEVIGLSASNIQWTAKTILQVISNNSVPITNSNIKTVDWVTGGLDFLEDDSFRPTTYQLDYFGSATGSDTTGYLDTDFRASRDQFLKDRNELLLRRLLSPTFSINIHSYPDKTIYQNDVLKTIKTALWSEYLSDINDAYESFGDDDDAFIKTWTTTSNLINIWFEPSNKTGLKPSDGLPGINRINVLPGVDINNIPTTGNPGDIIPVFDGDPSDSSSSLSDWYAWDENRNEFSVEFYYDYFSEIQDIKKERKDANLKALNELTLSIKAFLWAGEYLPSYKVKKDL